MAVESTTLNPQLRKTVYQLLERGRQMWMMHLKNFQSVFESDDQRFRGRIRGLSLSQFRQVPVDISDQGLQSSSRCLIRKARLSQLRLQCFHGPLKFS